MPDQVPQQRRRRSWLPLILVIGLCGWGFSSGYAGSLLDTLRSYLGMDAAASPWYEQAGDPMQDVEQPGLSLPPPPPVPTFEAETPSTVNDEAVGPQSRLRPPPVADNSRPRYNPHAPEIIEAGGSYAFQHARAKDPTVPITFDPCEPINVTVNAERAPHGYMGWIEPAIENTRAATGMDISLLGLTDDDRWRKREMNDPVLIIWATEAEAPELEGDTAGVGWFMAWGTASAPERAMSGSIVLDLDFFQDPFATSEDKRALVQHELAHVLGLAHVNGPSELMYPTSTVTEFGPGDLEGLARIGNAPCG